MLMLMLMFVQDLQIILTNAKQQGLKVRASGQRHSQPPQIVESNVMQPFWKKRVVDTIVVDMSLYQDIAPIDIGASNVRMKVVSRDLEKREAIVVVNAGTREDELEYFLGKENLALQTVTAGKYIM